MNFTPLLEFAGEGLVLALGGLLIGLMFGVFAQRSRFCLRASTVEFSRGILGPRFAIWAVVFASAVAFTQIAIGTGLLDVSEARQLAARGSLSGALIGGLMFGVGMILARGCASRLLVLSGTGNMRAIISGLILTLVAQASLRGVLSPARESLASLWTIDGGSSRNLLAMVGLGNGTGILLGLIWLGLAFWIVRKQGIGACKGWLGALGVGAAISLGWMFTFALSQQSFDPVAIKSISFTGPSADTLMGLINVPEIELSFDIGMVPGVFFGAMIAAIMSGEFKLQGFDCGTCMVRYISGASLMGFGSMLAGGCAVGAGVTGGSVFAVTAWLALIAMWAGAMATDYLIDRRAEMTGGDAAQAGQPETSLVIEPQPAR